MREKAKTAWALRAVRKEVATSTLTLLTGSYDYRFAGLSAVLAVSMNYAGFELGERIAAVRRDSRVFWLVCGGIAMGIGYWASQYVGMQAFTLPAPILYHYPTLGLGLLAAIFATTAGLSLAFRKHERIAEVIAASIVEGACVAAVPFLCIAAIRVPARLEYRWGLIAASWVLAAVVLLLALLVLLRLVRVKRMTLQSKVISALIVGSAVTLLPYLCLWAVRFHPSARPVDFRRTIAHSAIGIAATTATALVILLGAVIASVLEGLIESQEAVVEKAQQSEVFFRNLSEAIPGIIWTARADGTVDFASDRWYSYSGQLPVSNQELNWQEALHPEDLAPCTAKWAECVRTGEAFEIEYRLLRGSDGSYRWFLARATPVRDEHGQIIKWFGTVTDIEDQKQSQQILEEQIRERTEELAEANTRLQEEMWEKDLARKELDQHNERMLRELSERSQRATLLTKMGEHLQSCVTRDEGFPLRWVLPRRFLCIRAR